jgi:hypothetical protein
MDPALTADLLKIVNSAQYMLTKKVDNISAATKMVGIRGIKNLLYSYGAQKILGENTAEKGRFGNIPIKPPFTPIIWRRISVRTATFRTMYTWRVYSTTWEK